MTDYKKYINALRKYARMLEDDMTSIWNIFIPGLLKNTANLFNCKELECGKELGGHTEKDVARILSLEKESVRDKVREDVEQITDTMGVSYNQYISKIDVLQIIDKYKAESEV